MRLFVLMAGVLMLAGCTTSNMTAMTGTNSQASYSTATDTPPPRELRKPPRQVQGWGGNAYGSPGGSTY